MVRRMNSRAMINEDGVQCSFCLTNTTGLWKPDSSDYEQFGNKTRVYNEQWVKYNMNWILETLQIE